MTTVENLQEQFSWLRCRTIAEDGTLEDAKNFFVNTEIKKEFLVRLHNENYVGYDVEPYFLSNSNVPEKIAKNIIKHAHDLHQQDFAKCATIIPEAITELIDTHNSDILVSLAQTQPVHASTQILYKLVETGHICAVTGRLVKPLLEWEKERPEIFDNKIFESLFLSLYHFLFSQKFHLTTRNRADAERAYKTVIEAFITVMSRVEMPVEMYTKILSRTFENSVLRDKIVAKINEHPKYEDWPEEWLLEIK